MEHLSKKLTDVLRQLGDSPAEIAATLKAHEIRGVRNTVRFLNPIVRYVQHALGIGPFSVDLTEPETLRVAVAAQAFTRGWGSRSRTFFEPLMKASIPSLTSFDLSFPPMRSRLTE
jgi:hypothetical protein